jgi:hypothetical protein
MDYERFKQYMQQYRTELQDNDSSSWSEEARRWAESSGIFAGGGDNNFMWEDLLTREQAAMLLYRLAMKNGWL